MDAFEVRSQRQLHLETLSAHVTREGSLFGVDSFVDFDVVSGFETFSAEVAHVGPYVFVRFVDVSFEVHSLEKLLPTSSTLKIFDTTMLLFLVHIEPVPRSKGPPTLIAHILIRRTPMVVIYMVSQSRTAFRNEATKFACDRIVFVRFHVLL